MANTLDRRKRWLSPESVDQALVRQLEQETTLPHLVCRLLVQRGITDKEAARRFLVPKMEYLHDPMTMKGVPELVDRLLAAKERGARIGIHGDYDVDGITSTTLYTLVLRKLGFDITPFVPHRMIDGYGVSVRALTEFVDQGISVVLTCDTGFSALEEVRIAVEQGLEILITDHHHPPEVLPKAHALVNPHQKGCQYPFKELCGAGVAFKVLQALVRTMGLDEAEVLYPYLDLVALGTVADVVPLVDENRVLVKHGIRAARDSQNLGLRTLFEVAGQPLGTVSEATFGWIIGPRLNASGRIDDAAKGLQLLISSDPAEALALAQEIDRLNTERKKLSKAIEEDAIRLIDRLDLSDMYAIALFGNLETGGKTPVAVQPPAADAVAAAEAFVNAAERAHGTDGMADGAPAAPAAPPPVEWHHGVIGIVASRIVERYGRPTFLFALDETSKKWKGSGRAPDVGQVNLYDGLLDCQDHLLKFGGHAHAAGATLKGKSKKDLKAFAGAFNHAMRTRMAPEDRIPLLKADLEVRLADLTGDFYRMMQKFAPFGHGNEAVKMIAHGVTVLEARAMGADKTHLKLKVRHHGAEFDCVAWGFATRFPETLLATAPYQVDIFFQLKENTYRGQMSLQLELSDIRLSQAAMDSATVNAATRSEAETHAAQVTARGTTARVRASQSAGDTDDPFAPLGGGAIASVSSGASGAPAAVTVRARDPQPSTASSAAPGRRHRSRPAATAAHTTATTTATTPTAAGVGRPKRKVAPKDLFA